MRKDRQITADAFYEARERLDRHLECCDKMSRIRCEQCNQLFEAYHKADRQLVNAYASLWLRLAPLLAMLIIVLAIIFSLLFLRG